MSILSRRRRARRPEIDRDARRYMVYRLHDATGRIVYIGRSCDVAQRLKAHHSDAGRASDDPRSKADWFFTVRRVSMVGPYTWDEACRVERAEIEAHQPTGNRHYTKAHGYRPLAEGGGQYPGRRAPA